MHMNFEAESRLGLTRSPDHHGARQGSGRLGHATNAVMLVDLDIALPIETFSKFSVTAPTDVQLRVWRVERARLRCRA